MNSLVEKLNIFKSLFKGRDDVFAIRWEKENKSGYMPSYDYDPYRYRVHKMNGGTFQNFNEKSYLKLTDEQIKKHLNGEQLIGLYPLLQDNTSWFIAADFDKENWIEECRKLICICNEMNIPAYLERSRSGKGGHVWIFFAQPYPAAKSRKVIIWLLEQVGIYSAFDKSLSFDRLFPNQDYLSGKGLGNLIALPLYKKTLDVGNGCFIDINTLQLYPDQWQYLSSIKRISTGELDRLHQSIPSHSINSVDATSGKLTINLDNVVRMNRFGMSIQLINFLKEELNFLNSEFVIKKKIGRNTFGTERYFKLIEEKDNEVIVPKGFTGKLLRFCRDNKVEYDFHDDRKKSDSVPFSFNAALRKYQIPAIEVTSKKDIGIIVAPPGSGKTVIGLKIISEKLQPALIIVHRKQLADQWMERIEAFLDIPKHEIGRIGQGKAKIGKQVTIAMIQSLSKELGKLEGDKFLYLFGTVIVDECHHIPAETFRSTIGKLHTYYLYGLTATPFRKYNDDKIIFIHLGEVIAEIKPQEMGIAKRPKIVVSNTELDVPFNSKTDKFETLSKILVHDSARNKLILDGVVKELNLRRKVVILTERKEHIETLYQYLKHSHEVVTLSGDDAEINRGVKWKILKEGNYQVLITTGQFFGEGSDLHNAQCLFLVYPFSFEGKLIQYIGRVQRSEIAPIIYDYRDYKIDYLNKLFLKRNTYYRKLEKQNALFDDEYAEQTSAQKPEVLVIQRLVKISMDTFRYD